MLHIFIILEIVAKLRFWHWADFESGLIEFCSPWNEFLMISRGMGGGLIRSDVLGVSGEIWRRSLRDLPFSAYAREWHLALPLDVVKVRVRDRGQKILFLGGFCGRTKWRWALSKLNYGISVEFICSDYQFESRLVLLLSDYIFGIWCKCKLLPT